MFEEEARKRREVEQSKTREANRVNKAASRASRSDEQIAAERVSNRAAHTASRAGLSDERKVEIREADRSARNLARSADPFADRLKDPNVAREFWYASRGTFNCKLSHIVISQ